MTVMGVLLAARRRWWVVVVGLLATALACAAVGRAPGSYWTQVDVVFLAPASARYPNALEVTSQSVIATAGVVSHRVDDGADVTQLASSGTSLVGLGVREGQAVRLPNSGGQWAENFERPVLDVQVVGPTAADVQQRAVALLERIELALADLQDEAGVEPASRIVIDLAPRVPVVQHIGARSTRATAVSLALGLLLTLAAVLTADKRLGARPRADLMEAP